MGKLEGSIEGKDEHLHEEALTEALKDAKDALYKASKFNAIISAIAKTYWSFYDIDLETGNFEKLSVGSSSIRLTGRTGKAEEAFAILLDDFVHYRSRRALRKFTDLSTLAERMANRDTISQEYLSKNGHWYEGTFISSKRDEQGKVLKVLYIVNSVDERKQKELEYQKQRENLLSIFDALSQNFLNVFLVNKNDGTAKVLKLEGYVTTGINKLNENIASYDKTYRQYVSERVYEEDREMMYEAMNLDTVLEVLSREKEYVSSYRISKEGEIHYYQFKYTLLPNSDYIIAGYQCIDDIVEEQKKQQELLSAALLSAEQSNSAKTTFLSSMSHDIRTPMNAIIGFTALAESHIDDKALVQDYLKKITTSSSHLLNLINDILDMSRIESGSVRLEKAPLHLPDIFADLSTIVNGQIASKMQSFNIDTEGIVHEDVVADKLRLNQILLNIVSNAIKFTPQGGSINVCVNEKPCNIKDYASFDFTVEDNGIGMEESFIPHVFDAFSREQTTTESGVQGTGLGMAITKNLVDMMGGTIKVESKEGVGTKFTVSLNLEISESKEVTDKKSDGLTETTRPHCEYAGKKVLVVEDNDLNREIATVILKEAGFTVDSVTDGIEAVDIMHSEKGREYDFILMDIQMPRMDGYTATREIRTLNDNKKANIPIIAMTANAFEQDRRKAFEAGMNAHIAKPFDIDKLFDVIDDVLITGGVLR